MKKIIFMVLMFNISITSLNAQDILGLAAKPIYLPSEHILIGNSSNISEAVKINGDAIITNGGKLVLANTGVVAGIYENVKLAVDAKGRIIAITESELSYELRELKSDLEKLKLEIENLKKK
jgi:hypothetical protein